MGKARNDYIALTNRSFVCGKLSGIIYKDVFPLQSSVSISVCQQE